eukprot:COSAG01_NODE_15685_length_1310_cov_4.298101_1_plen_85_part_10
MWRRSEAERAVEADAKRQEGAGRASGKGVERVHRSQGRSRDDTSCWMCTAPPVGTGTFSRVRIARHKASGKYMALKILKKVRGRR